MKDNMLTKEENKILLLNLLLELQEQSRKAGVVCYCLAGTLLGAIRHGGFIPWDDDIDVTIMRKDYDKLVTYLEKNLSDDYFLMTRENTPLYYQEYPKLCYKNKEGVVSELAIDIFVYDETNPKRKLLRKYQNFLVHFTYHIKRYKVIKIKTGKAPKISNPLNRIMLSIFSHLSIKKMNKMNLSAMKMGGKKDTGYITNWGSHYHYNKSTFKKDVYGSPKKLLFEGLYIDVPEKYEDFLLQTYGKNYMQIPPKEKQINHGCSSVGCEDADLEKARRRVEKNQEK